MTMKWSVRCGVLVVMMTVSAGMAGEASKEEPKGSTPTAKVPTVSYMVASPRAYLAGSGKTGAIDYASMTGAADNFARPARPRARIIDVVVGTRVVFSLDPEAEGVWMQGSHGMIGTSLTLQWLGAKDCAECDDYAAADVNDAATASDSKEESRLSAAREGSDDATRGSDPNDTQAAREPARRYRWITVATDGARDIRVGPSIGCAKSVSVPVRFEEPGVYCLRAIVCTSVKSWHPRAAKRPTSREAEAATDKSLLPDNLLAVDIDIVHVAVRVADKPAEDGDKKAAADEDVVLASDMTDIADAEALSLDEDVLNDFGAFVGQQESDFVLPAEN
ncbi:MAG: hypothetical protein JW955_19450 [Sedimentisphaerales bacterium]|nr:hypothetical protein [Sedimentisphaerales bacterium]